MDNCFKLASLQVLKNTTCASALGLVPRLSGVYGLLGGVRNEDMAYGDKGHSAIFAGIHSP